MIGAEGPRELHDLVLPMRREVAIGSLGVTANRALGILGGAGEPEDQREELYTLIDADHQLLGGQSPDWCEEEDGEQNTAHKRLR